MSQKNFIEQPLPIPTRMRVECGTIALWGVGGFLCGYAVLFFALTMLLPGPIEPPSNMTWEEFRRQVDSGDWFWSDMKTCAVSGGIGGLLIALPFARLLRKGKTPAN